jgi:hypothetical protein
MTQCGYIYASGLRIKDGDGCVIVDGKKLRVVRDGNGKSRVDLQKFSIETGLTDGEISLRDLKTVLAERGEALTTLEVSAETPEGEHLRFYVNLDPSKAMGRQGREGDFKRTMTWLSPNQTFAENVSRYQLMTLPDSDKQAGKETAERLRLAVTTLGVARAQSLLDGRFGLLADQALLDETLAYITSENYQPSVRPWLTSTLPSTKRDEIGPTVLRIAGPAISDPSRVADEYFEHVVSYERHHELDESIKLEFVDNTFDRLADGPLSDMLYRGLKSKHTRAEYEVLITDPDRLQRITGWDSDPVPISTVAWELIDTGRSEDLRARWVADRARRLNVQALSPTGQEIHETASDGSTPTRLLRSLFKRSK